MGCTSTLVLAGVDFNCADVPVGGLKRLLIAKLTDVTVTITDDDLTAITVASGKVVELEFNNKDGFTSFTDEKTVEANGSVNVVPTIVVEFPKMTKTKRDELDAMSVAGLDLVAFVETAAGTKHAVGLNYGLYASLVSGKSGAGRSDKNTYQLTLTGQEDHLAYDAATVWATVVAGLA